VSVGRYGYTLTAIQERFVRRNGRVGSVSVTRTSVGRYLRTSDFECVVDFEKAFKLLVVQISKTGVRTC
jgi:hypothetical protein